MNVDVVSESASCGTYIVANIQNKLKIANRKNETNDDENVDKHTINE